MNEMNKKPGQNRCRFMHGKRSEGSCGHGKNRAAASCAENGKGKRGCRGESANPEISVTE